MAADPYIEAHQRWLGYLQPDGLVVSPAALIDCGLQFDQNTRPLQQRLLDHLAERQGWDPEGDEPPRLADFPAFLTDFLEWPAKYLVTGDDLPPDLRVFLRGYQEHIRPTHAVRHPREEGRWILLIQVLNPGKDLDGQAAAEDHHWQASPSRKFERLIRETKTGIGLLTNGDSIRLVYAPPGENPGALTFRVADLVQIAGRPILGGLHLLLHSLRIFGAEFDSLPTVLRKSREFQARVSTQLAGQVLTGLYALGRGLQDAHVRSGGKLLEHPLKESPQKVYEALTSVLMRMVFLLFAEDRGLVPESALYHEGYSLHGLYERLRQDRERYPDTMDQRYGAWARLLALFRLVHGGSRHPDLRMPAREGFLFDPERFPFLEGRARKGVEAAIPLIPDGTILTVLENLLILDGERLSYRTLDVEQIGSVYETIMGFRIEIATGRMVAIKPKKASGAPVHVDLDALLATKPGERAKAIENTTGVKVTDAAAKGIQAAGRHEDLLAALEKRIDRRATPVPVAAGSIYLQPTDERRRSGSHYTPRSFTEPIVQKTLEPVFARLGDSPTPDQILALKVADIAVGSAAFLVEACRQLADRLIAAWHAHGERVRIPADEDEQLFARRLVTQRCLYGVDRNPMAVDLAKLSLWLTTMARDHPFTFVDHAIKCGDSLVGLTNRQISAFHWDPAQAKGQLLAPRSLEEDVQRVIKNRTEILAIVEDNPASVLKKREKLVQAEAAAENVKNAGDLVIAAFFAEGGRRVDRRDEYLAKLLELHRGDAHLIPWMTETRESGQRPFHWEMEFPEVFHRDDPGFDAIVGNPPYAGKNTLIQGNGKAYLDWLQQMHSGAHGNSDLVAHFFRRAFALLRKSGSFGLIATNTISQGDTRHTGLRWIRVEGGGTIYAARRRVKWPGEAAVVVSVVWVAKHGMAPPFLLDGKGTDTITAFLFHQGGDETPQPLAANANKSFIGSYVLGMGFTFDDTDAKGVANSLAEMEHLIAKDPRNAERILPYLGGEEVNASPTHSHHRYVINFADFPLRRQTMDGKWATASEQQRSLWVRSGIVPADYPGEVAADWPDLLQIVDAKVRPTRLTDNREVYRRYWWQYAEKRGALSSSLLRHQRFLALSRVGQHLAFTFLPAAIVPAETIVAVLAEEFASFACLQCRVHEYWTLFFSSSLEDRLRYTPSDCFETFPFPQDWTKIGTAEQAGRMYYENRAELMIQNNVGLTKTYNRFHDPEEHSPDIVKLRELHAAMDRAVLDAYGWTDIPTTCEFLLDYEDDEEADDPGSGKARRPKKKPWRYRWPDEIRDEVLARLLELNQKRHEEEVATGRKIDSSTSGTPRAQRAKRPDEMV